MKITNRYGRNRDMTAVTMASIGIVLVMLLPIILCFFWLIWRMWCWVLPEIYPTGPDGFINPGFWLFLTAFVLVSIIVRAVFGGAEMKRLYLSGPMSKMPHLNFPAFHAEAARLRALGYDVVNPAELNPDPSTSWHQCMRTDLKALLDCDIIAMLPQWQKSAGAHLEMHIAHRVGIDIVIASEVVS